MCGKKTKGLILNFTDLELRGSVTYEIETFAPLLKYSQPQLPRLQNETKKTIPKNSVLIR